MSTQRLAILITGLVLLLIGGVILISGAASQSSTSLTIGALFALFGTTTNYLQLFFSFPIDSNRREERVLTQAPAPTQTSVPAQAPVPTSPVLMYFRLSGLVLIIGDIIFVAIGLLPY